MWTSGAICLYGVLFAAQATAQFNLYPPVDPVGLASAFNISGGCLTALNATVACDQVLLTMAGTVDNYLWDADNVTALCTSDCLSSSQTWFNNAYNACTDDAIDVLGKLVPPWTIPGRALDGLNIACLTPTTNVSADPGVSASIVNGTYYPTNSTDADTDSDSSNSTSVFLKREQSASSSGFCLIDSYSWVGSDIIRPDCTVASNQNDSQCIDPTDVPPDNERIANLYSDDLLCSPCFINMFFLRLASPYLPNTNHSDYLIYQYYDILEVCGNTEMPQLIVRELPYYDDAPGVTDGKFTNTSLAPFQGTTPSNSSTGANATCSGQTLTFDDIVGVTHASSNNAFADFCGLISRAYNVSSGDLYQAFGNYACDVDNSTATADFCVPQGCTVYNVTVGSTCGQLVADVSTPRNNITVQQLANYNPNFQGTCDSLLPQFVCITPPGGAYIPPPVNASSTNAGQQQRGGGDGTDTGNNTVIGTGNPAVTVSAGGAAPSPTQPGIIQGCTVYSNASVGDTCYAFAQEHNVTASNLYTWNSALGSAGAYCSTEFWSGYWYCIGTNTSQPSPVSPPGQPAPSPTQAGIVSNCDKYAQAHSGDTCASFAANQSIGTTQLYTWNTQLGAQGQNCNTEFWAGYYYCVDAPTTTTPGNPPPAAPSPTQSGIVSSCDQYSKVVSGDTCYSFAQKNAITTDQLYTWNTQLGAGGQNCATEFWAGYYYCIGVTGGKDRKRQLVYRTDGDGSRLIPIAAVVAGRGTDGVRHVEEQLSPFSPSRTI